MDPLHDSAVPGTARVFWIDRVSPAKLLIVAGFSFAVAMLGTTTWAHYSRSANDVIQRSHSLLGEMTTAAALGQPDVVLTLARDMERQRSGLRVWIFANDGRDLLGGHALAGATKDVIERRALAGPRSLGWLAVTARDGDQLLGSTARWFAADGLFILLRLSTLAVVTICLGGWLSARRMRAFGARFGVELPVAGADDLFGRLEDELRKIVQRANDGEVRLTALFENMPGNAYHLTAIAGQPIRAWPAVISPQGLTPARTAANKAGQRSAGEYVRNLAFEDRTHYERQRDAAIAANIRWQLEFRTVDGNGETRWLQDRGHATRDAQGQVKRIDGFLMDVTAQHHSDEQHRVLTRAIEQSASEILLVEPLQLRLNYANRGARQNLQLADDSAAEALELRELAALSDDFVRALGPLMRAEQQELRARLTMRRRDASTYVSDVVCSIVGEGVDRALLMVALDVTDQVRLEDELRASKERSALVLQASPEGKTLHNLACGSSAWARSSSNMVHKKQPGRRSREHRDFRLNPA